MKAKKWKKAQKWKHYMSMWGNKYLSERKGKKFDCLFRGKRFNIYAFRKEVMRITWHADHGPGFPYSKRGERASCSSNGVFFDYQNMKFEIGLQAGVNKNN